MKFWSVYTLLLFLPFVAFYGIKWHIYTNQNNERVYIDKDIIDGPHCMYVVQSMYVV